ncbi:MAG TPA: alpha/beta fold hydrolase [Kofleriaceae bacterium]|nr:alpha/beta fold hydrolase [Kofleriaceae bacterium]
MASIFTKASAALDRGVVRFMERRMAPRGTARFVAPDARSHLVELGAAYSAGTLGVPSPFFPTPDAPAATLTVAGDGPLGTQVLDIAFPSAYEPFLPAARALHHAVTENHTVHARWWTSDRGRPTIVLLHGWGGGNHWVTARAFVVPYWLRHGFDVAAFVLPYHGDRAPGGSGALFPSPNPMRTNEAFGQAVYDLRGLSMFLRAHGSSAIGAMGMSLGGYTTALWASVAGPDDIGGLDFAVAMIPAVSMASLMWRHGETSPMRVRAAKAGITEDLLVDAFAVHSPTTRPARVPRTHLAVIAGRGDRITPPEHAEALAAHWGVDVAWFDGGHLAQVGRGDALRAVRRQLCGLGFAGCARRS